MAVVYLVFTEGHTATSGDALVRVDLCDEAVRLARLLAELLPDESEVHGLLGLLLVTDARRATRLDADGDLVLLADQDRSAWDRGRIDEGHAHIELALRRAGGAPGPYALQGAIAAVHGLSPSWTATDWDEIVGLYDLLVAVQPDPGRAAEPRRRRGGAGRRGGRPGRDRRPRRARRLPPLARQPGRAAAAAGP